MIYFVTRKYLDNILKLEIKEYYTMWYQCAKI